MWGKEEEEEEVVCWVFSSTQGCWRTPSGLSCLLGTYILQQLGREEAKGGGQMELREKKGMMEGSVILQLLVLLIPKSAGWKLETEKKVSMKADVLRSSLEQ